MILKNNYANACIVRIPPLYLHSKNVNFFIVKVLVKSNKGGCEVTLIYFYTYLMFYILPSFHFSIILLTFGGAKIIKVYG